VPAAEPRPVASGPARETRVGLPAWIDQAVEWDRALEGEDRMRLAVRLARENVRREMGGPFGAAVFETETGRLVSVGVNRVMGCRNSALHAEVVALMLAHERTGSFTLSAAGMPSHELVSSCEPCAMCLGAALWSGVRRIVWAACREDATGLGFDEGPVFPESHRYVERRGIELRGGVLRADGRAVLEEYVRSGGLVYNG
jgi:tRNA(Arg) A34 adenosine deaminase TadA